MNTPQAHLPDCPNCGAPLDLQRVRQGAVDCSYCGKTIALRSLPAFAADPAAVQALEQRAAPPTLAAPLFRTVARYFEVPVAFGAAWSLVAAWFVFRRGLPELPFVWAALAAVAALFALAWKRRLAAIALTLAVGGLNTLKPFLQPIVDAGDATYSPTSETALMYYLIPGVLLLALGALAVLSLRPARIRTDLALLKPTVPAALAFLVGAALAAWNYGGTTNRDLLEQHAGRLATLQETYARLGPLLAADPPPSLPARLESLDPPPRFDPDDPAANTDFAPLATLHYPGRHTSPDPFLLGDLSAIFQRVHDHYHWDDWERTPDLERQLARALATRYVATGGCAERDDSEDPFDDCVVWLLELRTGTPLLRASVPTFTTSYFDVSRDMLATLQELTGGTFRRGD